MFNAQALTEKWAPVLGHESAGAIKDNYRKAVTAEQCLTSLLMIFAVFNQ